MASLRTVRWPDPSRDPKRSGPRRWRSRRGRASWLEIEPIEDRVLLTTAADGLSVTTASITLPTTYTTVDSLTVSVDSAKTGLYNLAFGATAGLIGSTYEQFRVLVDGSPYDPSDIVSVTNFVYSGNSSNQAVSLVRQLTLTQGTHQIQVQAQSNSSSDTLADAKLQVTGYNQIAGQNAADGLSVTNSLMSLPAAAYITVDSLTVNVDSTKTGLYDLAFGATAVLSGYSYEQFRILVDGNPYDSLDNAEVTNYDYADSSSDQPVSLVRQLTLTQGTHQIQVQAQSNSPSDALNSAKLQVTGYNRIAGQNAADGLSVTTENPVLSTSYTTVDSLTVNVDSAKTGLYDLAFGATAGLNGGTFEQFRVLVDGTPYDPNDVVWAASSYYGSYYGGYSYSNGYSYPYYYPYSYFNDQIVSFARQLTLAPGTHQIQVQAEFNSLSSSDNLTDAKLQVTGYNQIKAVPTLSVTDPGGNYNDTAFTATATVAGVIAGVDTTPGATLEGVAPTLAYYAGTYATVAQTSGVTPLSSAPTAAGAYTVVATFGGSVDYQSATALANFVVNQATPTVSVIDAGGTYNGSAFAATGSVQGVLVNGTPEDLGTPTFSYDVNTGTDSNPIWSPLGGAPIDAGRYRATAAYAGSTNYANGSNSVTFAITPATLTVTPDPVSSKVYGTTATLTGAVSGQQNGETFTATYTSPGASAGAGVGTYTIGVASVSPNGTANLGDYTLVENAANLTVVAAPLSIVADSASVLYGQPLPTLTGTLAGVVNDDGITASYSTTATAASHVGAYPITPTLNDPNNRLANYSVTGTPGTLTIAAAATTTALVTSAPADVYGGPVSFTATVGALAPSTATPTGTVQFQVDGVNLGAPVTLVDGSATSAVTTALAAGDHAVTAVYLAGADFAAGTPASLTQTVAKADLIVTADDQSKTYGDPNPTLTAGFTGFVNGDSPASLAGILAFSTTATPASHIGTYPITADGLTSNNYNITYLAGTLTITPAPLTVTADPQTKVYGLPDPALTYQVAGLVNGDTADNVLAGSLTRDPGETVAGGPYAITIGSLAADPDYALTFNTSSLTITPATLVVTPADAARDYGDADPTFSGTINGLVPGDIITANYSTNASADSPVGNYDITANLNDPNGLLGNYAVTLNTGTLTIARRAVAVAADPETKVYGDADPALTYRITTGSLASGDSFLGALTRDPGEGVGSYAIQIGTLSLGGNYDLSFAGANLAVTPRSVAVAADPETKVYGDADPALTYQLTSGSLAFHDVFTGALTRDPGENVGGYAIGQGTLTLGSNYSLSYTGANLTVSPRPIAVAADPQTKVFGAVDPALTYHITAGSLASGDGFSGGLTRVPGENPGAYAIGQGSLTAGGNYALAYTGANLTIGKASTTTTVASSANPAMTGQPVTFTAAVAVISPGGGTPAGSVVFATGSTVLATVPLSLVAGVDQAAFATTTLPAGATTVTATYVNTDGDDLGSSASLNQTVLGTGVFVSGTTLYIVGANTSDHAQVEPVGSRSDGSTGLKVEATLNHVKSSRSFNQPFTAIVIAGFGGNDRFELDDSLTLPTMVTEGNGNNTILLGDGNNLVALGDGNNQVVLGNGNNLVTAGGGNNTTVAGNGNNTITLGNGNDSVTAGSGDNNVTVGDGNDLILLGNGDNVVVEGNGNDGVVAGDGANLVVAGLGKHLIVLGDGDDILVDGAVTLAQPGDSLRRVLTDWKASAVTAVNQRLKVTYNTAHPSFLVAGSGRDWFFYTDPKTLSNRKASDRLN